MNVRPSALVVIATFRRPDHVRECLSHLAAQTVAPDRVVVVDASPDRETEAVVGGFAAVEYARNERGIGATATSRAIGITRADEEVAVFIDDDAYAEPQWLERLLNAYADPTVAAVGGRARNGQPGEEDEGIDEIGLLRPDGSLTGNFAADPGRVVEVDHLLGANMSVRLSVVRELGGIRDFYPGTCLREETDIALRMRRAQYRIVYVPDAVVRHVAGSYAKGKRFDGRYRYYGARNHVVLLATTLGWRDKRFRRYSMSVLPRAGGEIAIGFRALLRRNTILAKARGFAGGFRRATLDLAGTIAGFGAAVRATSLIARGRASSQPAQ